MRKAFPALLLLMMLVGLTAAASDPLTTEERRWLDAHAGEIRFAPSPDYPPVCFRDENGEYCGITMDIIRLMEERLGFRFRLVECQNWAEIMARVKSGGIDVVGDIQENAERRRYLRFTQPYIKIPNAIIVRRDETQARGLADMDGMSVAVVKGYATFDYVAEQYPNVKMVPVPDTRTGLQMVSFGSVDAIVTDLAVASRTIDELGIDNLHVAGWLDYTWKLAFGSRSDWPILHDILVKGLAQMEEEELIEITRQWIRLPPHGRSISPRVFRGLMIVCALVVLAVIAALLWNRVLRRHVQDATTDLRESESRLRSIIENMPVMMDAFDEDGMLVAWSRECEEVTGYSAEQMVGNPRAMEMLYPEPEYREKMLKAWKERGNNYRNWEWDIVCRDGTVRTIAWSSSSALFPIPGWSSWGIGVDVTDRVRAQEEIHAVRDSLEQHVSERTDELRKIVRTMAGREVRMAELKKKVRTLEERLRDLGQAPERGASDEANEEYNI